MFLNHLLHQRTEGGIQVEIKSTSRTSIRRKKEKNI